MSETQTTDTAPESKADTYGNYLTGLGFCDDVTTAATIVPNIRLAPEQAEILYEQDAIAARIVDRLVDDATREEIILSDVDESGFDFGPVASGLEDLDVRGQLGDAWRWSRLYGGALAILNVNDGRPMHEPLDMDNVTKLNGIRVVEAPWVTPAPHSFAMGSNGFRRPEFYSVNFTTGRTKDIHWTRVIRFEGIKTPPRVMERNRGWGPSVLDRVRTEISQLGESMRYGRNILQRISILVLKIDELRKRIEGNKEGSAEMQKMVRNFQFSIDNLHMLLLDNSDDLSESTRTVSGITDLMERFVSALVRATDMPRTVLLGEQPAGLSANADSEIRAWYDYVRGQQRAVLTPAISRVLEVVFAIMRNSGQDAPEEWTVDYKPLWQPSEKEQAETRLLQAQVDDSYMLSGVYSDEEVRARLISEGQLDAEPGSPVPEDEEEPEEDPNSLELLEEFANGQSPQVPTEGSQRPAPKEA
jgi:phage-related protein (TIGR01555 family)